MLVLTHRLREDIFCIEIALQKDICAMRCNASHILRLKARINHVKNLPAEVNSEIFMNILNTTNTQRGRLNACSEKVETLTTELREILVQKLNKTSKGKQALRNSTLY